MTENKRFKDFGAGTVEEAAPLSFKLHGEEFFCHPLIQGKVLLNLVSSTSGNDPAASAAVVSDFFNYVLEPESSERFNNLLVDPVKIVSMDTLAEITSWLMEEYTSRPNQQPED